MPNEIMIAVVLIVVPFAVFALALAYADRATAGPHKRSLQ